MSSNPQLHAATALLHLLQRARPTLLVLWQVVHFTAGHVRMPMRSMIRVGLRSSQVMPSHAGRTQRTPYQPGGTGSSAGGRSLHALGILLSHAMTRVGVITVLA